MSEQTKHEWLSAMTDDALADWPEGQVLAEADVHVWHGQQLAASALRGEPVCGLDSTARLLAAMQQTYATTAVGRVLDDQPGPQSARWWQKAANDAHGAWPWAAALVLAVGTWVAWPNPSSAPVVVAENNQSLVASGGVLRDPQLDALLQTHRQWGGGSALQFPAGYVRNVALER